MNNQLQLTKDQVVSVILADSNWRQHLGEVKLQCDICELPLEARDVEVLTLGDTVMLLCPTCLHAVINDMMVMKSKMSLKISSKQK